jgi:hypothetical protein
MYQSVIFSSDSATKPRGTKNSYKTSSLEVVPREYGKINNSVQIPKDWSLDPDKPYKNDFA